MSRLLVLPIALVVLAPAALAAGPGFYAITASFTSPFSGTVTTPAGLTCVQAPVPAPEVEVRCTAPFAASLCKSPSVEATLLGLDADLAARSICAPAAQADCAASVAGLALAAGCSDDEATLGAALTQWLCHVVPSGGVLDYRAECRAYIG